MTGLSSTPHEWRPLLFEDLVDFAVITPDPEAFCGGFVQRFKQIGLSQVGLSVHSRSAAQLGHHVDMMEVGHDAVSLERHGTMASLSIRAFMGVDTGPRITDAFEEITSNGATGLIISLRDNPAGSFAMRHLVGHRISDRTNAGVHLRHALYDKNA